MKLAVAQINPVVGDLKGNTAKIIEYIKKAKKKKANLVVFPELAVTGYPPKDLLLKPHFIDRNLRALNAIIRATRGITAIVGFVDSVEGELYNAAAIISHGKLVGVQHKMHLPNYDVFDEHRYFSPARGTGIYQIAGVSVGITICEDIWVDPCPVLVQVEKGAKLLVNISASPFYAGKDKIRRELISKRAKTYRVPIVYVNMVGGQDDLILDGRSYVFNKNGQVIAQAKMFEEELLVTSLKGKAIAPKDDLIAEVHDALVLAIKDYVRKNDFDKAVIGVSGGIDSSVTLALAVEALGRQNVVAVSMPSHVSSKGSVEHAKQLAKNLGVKFMVIPITDTYNEYIRMLKPVFKGRKQDVTEENIQARVRGNILMALSNKFGYLVLSTGNKSEMAVGYCTLYGDMSGGISVLSDVPKTMLYKLAKYINWKKAVIPTVVLRKEPSAELRAGQKDRDALPPYDLLDKILQAYIEQDKCRDEIVAMGFDAKIVDKVITMVDHNEYKRHQAPVGFRITPKAFGPGRRMPITNKYEC